MSEPAAATCASTPAPGRRLASLDVWRGAIVVLMAVDHAAAFLGQHPSVPEGLQILGRPARPDFDTLLAWFTRFITHYCAPGFVFLAGASVVLMTASRLARGRSQSSISAQLLLRGVVLIVLEYTVILWAWAWAVPHSMFAVIACIGACLILGAFARFTPAIAAWCTGFALLFGYPLLADPELFPPIESVGAHWRRVLLVPEPLAPRWASLYPVIPWFSMFLLGIGWGKAVVDDASRALSRSAWTGLVFLGLWLLLRLTDGFAAEIAPLTRGYVLELGNPTPYDPGRGWMDFFMMSKYPPAADFALWTLGGGLLFCWAVGQRGIAESRALAPLRLFGRTPLFFYIAHLYLYRFLATRLAGEEHWLPRSTATVWIIWALGLVVLWPLCRLFARLKRRYPGFPLDLF